MGRFESELFWVAQLGCVLHDRLINIGDFSGPDPGFDPSAKPVFGRNPVSQKRELSIFGL